RFYDLKRSLLGYDTLFDYDRYAPLLQNRKVIDWAGARATVLDTYTDFHPQMGTVAKKFFEHSWIDAAMKPGKRGGAFSASTVPCVHPYVVMNYDGEVRDVRSPAHERWHRIHRDLSRKQAGSQANTALTTAEAASVFGERLTLQSFLEQLDDPWGK